MLNKSLNTWSACAPTKTKDRQIWVIIFGKELEKEKGCKIIAGDFNSIMNTKLD